MWTNAENPRTQWTDFYPEIDFVAARSRVAGKIARTPVLKLPPTPAGLTVHGKMENRQVTGSFKARGALNNLAQLTDSERERGVVASSSGNHGQALAWAAKASGVGAVIVMPKDAYPNKIEACRSHGAEVVLAENRIVADDLAKEFADGGRVWVHPYDRLGTVEGAGTVGLELVEEFPDLDVVVLCVGGGGLSAGCALALRRSFEQTGRPQPMIVGAEPDGAAAMEAALCAGASVRLDTITSHIQGLTTPYAGHINVEINTAALDAVMTVSDDDIYAAQGILVNDHTASGWTAETVEPAGAAAFAVTRAAWFVERIEKLMRGRNHPRAGATDLRIAVTVSGGNPAPAQLAGLRS